MREIDYPGDEVIREEAYASSGIFDYVCIFINFAVKKVLITGRRCNRP